MMITVRQKRFLVGDIVSIINESLQSYGMVGEVVGYGSKCDLYYVRFDDWNGENNKVLCFSEYNLKHMEGNEMASNNAVTGNYDIAWVKFFNPNINAFNKEYAFALFDPEIRAGDCVLVDSNGDYKVAKVFSIVGRAVYNGAAPTKEVICKVDFSEYERRKKIREQKKILRKQMDELVSKNQELILYQAIAKDNPEMAAMLEEYKALGDDV